MRGNVSEVFDTLKKSFDDIACFVKFCIKIVCHDGVGLVGDTGNGVFLRNIFADFIGTKSLVRLNFFAFKSNFAQ